MDNADFAAERQQQEMDAALARIRADQHRRRLQALDKCQECGALIEAYRRDWAECCIDCTRDRERWERTTGMDRRR